MQHRNILSKEPVKTLSQKAFQTQLDKAGMLRAIFGDSPVSRGCLDLKPPDQVLYVSVKFFYGKGW